MEIPKQYRPVEHESRIWDLWVRAGLFHAEPTDGASYCIVIPPPNVTARLHLGHALNNSLQDMLVRVHRMKGFETLWMPGTDHAGIATQTVVEKRVLREEGRRRTDFERDEFVQKIQAFKDEYEGHITSQLERMGCSCDWERQRFTMDETCAKAVREAFYTLFRDGLIYRGKRLVNWDPVTQTALADDEVETEDIDGFFYYMRYPIVDSSGAPVSWASLKDRGHPEAAHEGDAWLTVATTRPETYLGDTAVALNPKDPRAASLEGLFVSLPFVGRVIPIITDDYVVMPDPESDDAKAKYASGFLKVTPAHDPNDWEIGQRHELEVINIMAPDASISDEHGWDRAERNEGGAEFVGLSRENARERIVEAFKDASLLEDRREYTHAVGHSYRSHAAIEPYLSDQWYVRVTDDRMRGSALRAMATDQRTSDEHGAGDHPHDGTLRFYPARYAKTFETWHLNLRDWCISRQLWWGHQIPVWHPEHLPHLEDIEPTTLQSWIDILRGYAAEGRIAVQYRGEFVDLVQGERPDGHSIDQPDIYICVRDPGDQEVIDFIESKGYARDEDVLDTWFSSALWPMSTMGWPEPTGEMEGLLETFNPTNVLSTGRDIITLWVSRMVMFNRYFMDGGLPFGDVFIHPLIMDGDGQKMSKTLGNGVDPNDIIDQQGADAMRFTLCDMTTSSQDARVSVDLLCPFTGQTFEATQIRTKAGHIVAAPIQTCPTDPAKKMVTTYGLVSGEATPTEEMPLALNTSSKFDYGRNFCNKVWNAGRFALGILADTKTTDVALADLSPIDRWMLSRLASTTARIDEAISQYHFSDYAKTIYHAFWNEFCDVYLEAIKPTVHEDPKQAAVLRTSLECLLRLLHPIIPFVTESMHEHLRRHPLPAVEGVTLSPGDLLAGSGWPTFDGACRDEGVEGAIDRMLDFGRAVREVRARHNVHRKREITLHVDEALRTEIREASGVLETLTGVGAVTTDAPTGPAVTFTFDAREFHASDLADEVDVESERERLMAHLVTLEKAIENLEKRLSNPGYVEKAPEKLVAETRAELESKRAELASTRDGLGRLG